MQRFAIYAALLFAILVTWRDMGGLKLYKADCKMLSSNAFISKIDNFYRNAEYFRQKALKYDAACQKKIDSESLSLNIYISTRFKQSVAGLIAKSPFTVLLMHPSDATLFVKKNWDLADKSAPFKFFCSGTNNHFNKIPKSIMREILSFLPMNDIVRSSITSREYQDLTHLSKLSKECLNKMLYSEIQTFKNKFEKLPYTVEKTGLVRILDNYTSTEVEFRYKDHKYIIMPLKKILEYFKIKGVIELDINLADALRDIEIVSGNNNIIPKL